MPHNMCWIYSSIKTTVLMMLVPNRRSSELSGRYSEIGLVARDFPHAWE